MNFAQRHIVILVCMMLINSIERLGNNAEPAWVIVVFSILAALVTGKPKGGA